MPDDRTTVLARRIMVGSQVSKLPQLFEATMVARDTATIGNRLVFSNDACRYRLDSSGIPSKLHVQIVCVLHLGYFACLL